MSASTDVKTIFDRTAPDYDRHLTPCRMRQFFILAHELGLAGTENVLEIGSGPGALSAHLAEILRDGHVTGVDLSDRMVGLASGRSRAVGLPNVSFEKGDAMSLRFPDGTFDAVVSSYLVTWVPDVTRYFAEAHRVLKGGGKLGIIAPSPEMYGGFREACRTTMGRHLSYGSPRANMIGLRMMPEDELLGALSLAGFSVQRAFQMNFKERLGPEAYMSRINAITNERYLDLVPSEERGAVRTELMRELAAHCRKGAITTECPIIVIAEKGRPR